MSLAVKAPSSSGTSVVVAMGDDNDDDKSNHDDDDSSTSSSSSSISDAVLGRGGGADAASSSSSSSSSAAAAVMTLTPSHILQDGTFVYLSPPSDSERTRFFERSIARHGLLKDDLKTSTTAAAVAAVKKGSAEDEADENAKEKEEEQGGGGGDGNKTNATTTNTAAPKIHPLALASARLQANGINELNRAINLHTLVATNEYFGLVNIVDPSHERALMLSSASTSSSADGNTAKSSSSADNKNERADGGTSASNTTTTTTAAAHPSSSSSSQQPTAAASATTLDDDNNEEARVRARHVLKRKRAQFEQACATLHRHGQRVQAAAVAQQQVDVRLRALRRVWRLVAPEHGTRALPHAVQPTSVVCADVDVYYNQNNTPLHHHHNSGSSSHRVMGRLASRVPRYATVELCDDYTVAQDLKEWKEKHFPDQVSSATAAPVAVGDAIMDVDQEDPSREADETKTKDESKPSRTDETDVTDARVKNEPRVCTRAEPFAIADPALGKLDADFDPNKIAMLTLQFDIEKPSTGYCESACLEPISTKSTAAATTTTTTTTTATINSGGGRDDEKLLVALQHSLFCAKLFESIRRELAPDTEGIGQVRTTAKAQSAVWLIGEPDENFLPPPLSMMSGPNSAGLAPLCIVHVHEGDVKVFLDCEYSLRVRLVEAGASTVITNTYGSSTTSAATLANSERGSGSQSPAQLRTLCQALLLHAQETHHRHSVQTETKLRKEREEEEQRHSQFLKENPHVKVVPQVKKKETVSSPCSLQSCVSLGTKMLFERRIRKTLKQVKDWLKAEAPESDGESLLVEWLALSVFDLTAQFTVSFRSWSIDANIVRDELTVTRFGENGYYRKAKFHSDKEFELYLKIALRRILRTSPA